MGFIKVWFSVNISEKNSDMSGVSTQQTVTCSKSEIGTLEKGVKYV